MATIKELRAQAKAYGITGRSKMTTKQLKKAIRDHELTPHKSAEIQDQHEQAVDE